MEVELELELSNPIALGQQLQNVVAKLVLSSIFLKSAKSAQQATVDPPTATATVLKSASGSVPFSENEVQ